MLVLSFVSLALAGLCPDREPFTFAPGVNAPSTVSKTYTILYAQPAPGQESGAQFPYTKNVGAGEPVGLATVSLVGGGREFVLQTGFAPIVQQCSCYWLDAKELAAAPHSVPAGEYRIRIKQDGGGYDVVSGAIYLETSVKRSPLRIQHRLTRIASHQ